jgi:hypothetical protein
MAGSFFVTWLTLNRDEPAFAAGFRMSTARRCSERRLAALERFWEFVHARVLIKQSPEVRRISLSAGAGGYPVRRILL